MRLALLLFALTGCVSTGRESQASRDRLNCVYEQQFNQHMTRKHAEDWCAK